METMKPTDEQKREFWKGCGLKEGTYGWLYDPNNRPDLPIFPPIDLNNLFKYAVPKLSLLRFSYETHTIPELYRWETMKPNQSHLTVIESNDPALALFWAIYEAIK